MLRGGVGTACRFARRRLSVELRLEAAEGDIDIEGDSSSDILKEKLKRPKCSQFCLFRLSHIDLGLGEIKITFEDLKCIILCECGSQRYEISEQNPYGSYCQ